MKHFFAFLIILVSYNFLNAGIPEFMKPEYEFKEYRPEFQCQHNCSHKHHNLNAEKFSEYTEDSYIEKRTYDALSYDVYLDWSELLAEDSFGREFTGSNEISLKIDEDSDVIELDIKYLQIDSIFSADKKLIPNDDFFYIEDELSITDRNFKTGDTVNYKIYFTYNHFENRGIYIYKDQPNPVVYTQNEPEDARYWLPSNDRPYDKVISSIAIKVPASYTATSNGFAHNTEQSEDEGTVTYFYSHPYPITTYLMVANASEYITFRHWYKRIENPNDSIPVDYFVWEEDYLPEVDTMMEDTRNAHYAFRNTTKMIEIMAELYGEYPFEKYGMTAVEPYSFGGMEHQTMTTVHRNWLYGYAGLGILHEVAHQWLGDLITCATWNDIWINEGGATFSEHIFYEKFTGNPYYYELFTNDKINRVLKDDAVKEYSLHNLPTNMIFREGYTLSYYKASIVYHMLRYWLGDDVFFSTLRNMIEDNKFTSMESKDFANYFINNIDESPVKLEKYFEQWIWGVGFPVYEISGTYTKELDTLYSVNLNIEQVQEEFGFYEEYEMPVHLILEYDMMPDDTIMVYNDSKMQEINLELKAVPDNIYVYKLSVLNESDYYDLQDVTSVSNADEKKSHIYPNPLVNNNKVFIESEDTINKITLIDELGTVISKHTGRNIILSENLNSGIYFILVETSKGIETHKLIYMK